MDQQRSPVATMIPYTPILQALILPEVLFCIGCYLNTHQALICSQVCSTWYINFAPLVWTNVHIGRPKPDTVDCQYICRRDLEPRIRSINLVSEGCNPRDQLDIVRNKASWLRSLTIHQHVSPLQFNLGKECTQLRAISITGPIPFNNDYTRDYWNSCKALIKQNRSRLKSLSLEGTTQLHFSGKPTPGVPRWDPILSCVGHTHLTELKLVLCSIRGRHLKPFWKICERLEKLTLDRVSFDISRTPTQEQIQNNSKAARAARKRAARRPNKNASPPPPPPKRFPNLQELTVKGVTSPERFVDLIIADCPRLESLDWTVELLSAARMEVLSNHIVAGTWPLLEKLNLSLSFNEGQMLKILQHTRKPLKVVTIGYVVTLAKGIVSILKERHYQTLQEVDLSGLRSDPEGMVQDVLASCHSLEIIKATLLDAAAVKEDKRPWVCLGLRELTMSIDITKGTPGESEESVQDHRQEQSHALFAQIARLKQLRHLSLRPSQPRLHPNNKEPIRLRLGMGLHLLTAQTQLEVVYLYRGQNMDRNDVLWMVEHWKSLRMVSGGLLNDKKSEQKAFKGKYLWDFELAKTLNDHGIETPSSSYGDGYLDEVRHLLGKGWPDTDDLVYVEEEPETLEETARAAQEVQAADEWSPPGPAEWVMGVVADWTSEGWAN
ncbi:hypothetical protein BGZ75_004625 [Mortierella antarctica]|nr:hypothetical protein BGZ75_004625 [Mortierella antarctica]